MPRLRRAGSPWRLLVHDWLGTGGATKYGASHDVTNDPTFGGIPDRLLTEPARQALAESRTRAKKLGCTETVLPNTEFDELVVGRWLHVEQMDTGFWWMDVGGVTLQVSVDREGRPKSVTVYGPNDYAEPVPGVEYECTWSGDA